MKLIAATLIIFTGTSLVFLAYTINRNMTEDAKHERESAATAKTAMEARRHLRGIEAWSSATKTIGASFSLWCAEACGGSSAYTFVRAYQNTDVKWTDDSHVVISGFIGRLDAGKTTAWYSWIENLLQMDDGEWGYPGGPSFHRDENIQQDTGQWIITKVQ